MNPHPTQLQPYPFEKLRCLFAGVTPPTALPTIKLSIGEPQHETPDFIKRVLTENLSGLASYPSTQGSDALRQAIAETDFARELLRQYNVTVLPGSFLARENAGVNPGANFLRIALVAGVDECIEAARRIAAFCQKL